MAISHIYGPIPSSLRSACHISVFCSPTVLRKVQSPVARNAFMRVASSKPVAFLLADLGVTKTHSRPRVSNDNPCSQSQFRTLKYRPEFPDRFGCLQDSGAFSQRFFRWYNQEHRQSGLGLLTPAMVYYGQAESILQQRQAVLEAAYQRHPERFVRNAPKPSQPPGLVWINKPVPLT